MEICGCLRHYFQPRKTLFGLFFYRLPRNTELISSVEKLSLGLFFFLYLLNSVIQMQTTYCITYSLFDCAAKDGATQRKSTIAIQS